jgi:hypothetical protein
MSETEKLARMIRHCMVTLGLFLVVWWLFPIGRDSTDPVDGRSGMVLLTDAATGCQYLARDGITSRLGAGGKQMGCRP